LKANTIDFTNTTTATTTAGLSIIWFFGDGSTTVDSSWNTTHTFSQAGKYEVCLRVQSSSTCLTYQCDSVVVSTQAPVCNTKANYSWKVDSSKANTIDFTNTTTATNTAGLSIRWFFGDGSTIVDSSWNTTHTFPQAGKYEVCLRVQSGPTCVSYQCDSVVVSTQVPVCNTKANYSWKVDSLKANTIDFTNTTTATTTAGLSVRWFFGDGSTTVDSSWNTAHTFSQAGKYEVCLRVQSSPTCVSYQCDSVVVSTQVPVCNTKANYSWKVDSSKANTIDFTSTTTATNTAGLSVRWYFGDGSTIVDSSWNTTHTFPQAGKYFVCLRVQSSPTCVSYQCDSVVVSTQVPVCNSSLSLFTTLQSTGNSLSYYFKPTYPNSTVKYTWTFGDLTGSTNEAAQHQYAQAGNYTACLTAYRDSTCASTTCKELDVTGRSDCDSFSLSFSHYASTESAPNNIHFYAIANFPLQQEIWAITKLSNTVDSAIVLDQTNPVYLFNDTGYYNVCLKMMAPGSCAKEYCDTVHVKATATSCHLQAYPDPAHAQVSVNVPLTANGIIHAYLYNLQGVLLSQENQQGSLGNNLVTMNTQNLASGEYIIRVTYGSSICYAKFMKM